MASPPATPSEPGDLVIPRSARIVAIGLALATILGCASASGSSPPAAAPVTPSAAPSTAVETPEPSVDRHGVPELEALLPARVAGVDLERLSLTGADFYALGSDESRARLDAMLANLGKTTADLSVGDAGDPTGRAVLEVGVFRVEGTGSNALLSEWVASRQAASPGAVTVSNATVAGRALTRLVDARRPVGGVTYVFVKGDALFLVAADDQALVADALAQLPQP